MRETLILFRFVCLNSSQRKKEKRKKTASEVTEKVAEVWVRQTFFVLSASDPIVVYSYTNHLDVFLVIR